MIPLYVLDLGRQHRAHISESRHRHSARRHLLEAAAAVAVLAAAAVAITGGPR